MTPEEREERIAEIQRAIDLMSSSLKGRFAKPEQASILFVVLLAELAVDTSNRLDALEARVAALEKA